MDTTKEPGISFDTIFLQKLDFSREPKINSPKIDLAFNSNISFTEDKKHLIYEMGCDVSDINKAFRLSCKMIGMFSAINGAENMQLDEFSKVNAPALILPYLREIVTTTTVRAGLTPVVFPPINVASIFSKLKVQGTNK